MVLIVERFWEFRHSKQQQSNQVVDGDHPCPPCGCKIDWTDHEMALRLLQTHPCLLQLREMFLHSGCRLYHNIYVNYDTFNPLQQTIHHLLEDTLQWTNTICTSGIPEKPCWCWWPVTTDFFGSSSWGICWYSSLKSTSKKVFNVFVLYSSQVCRLNVLSAWSLHTHTETLSNHFKTGTTSVTIYHRRASLSESTLID